MAAPKSFYTVVLEALRAKAQSSLNYAFDFPRLTLGAGESPKAYMMYGAIIDLDQGMPSVGYEGYIYTRILVANQNVDKAHKEAIDYGSQFSEFMRGVRADGLDINYQDRTITVLQDLKQLEKTKVLSQVSLIKPELDLEDGIGAVEFLHGYTVAAERFAVGDQWGVIG